MSKEDFIEAMGYVDDRILERYAKEEDGLNAKRPGKMWIRWVAAAACLAVIFVLTAILLPQLPVLPIPDTGGNLHVPTTMLTTNALPTMSPTLPAIPTTSLPIPNPPEYFGALFTAQEIADLFPKMLATATNAYEVVCVSDAQYLGIRSHLDWDTLPIFQYQPPNCELDEAELQSFVNRFLPDLSISLGEHLQNYTIQQSIHGYNQYHAYVDSKLYDLTFYQNAAYNSVSLRALRTSDASLLLRLDGKTVKIDQKQTDQEILESLKDIRDELFHIFEVNFSNAKVSRQFDETSNHGAMNISVYYFNETDHPLNTLDQTNHSPYSDYIVVTFSNHRGYGDDLVSSSILIRAEIMYRTKRTETYQESARVKKIPLKEAEALLYNGYVFGGHSCPLCMAAQDKVDFEGYDYVGLEYVFGVDNATGTPTTGIPFYAFYKQIGIAKNGNLIFAKTYVPAIEVSGYTEYFESQKEEHPS